MNKILVFLLITHDIALISELVDNICIMYSGQIIEFGTVKDNNKKT